MSMTDAISALNECDQSQTQRFDKAVLSVFLCVATAFLTLQPSTMEPELPTKKGSRVRSLRKKAAADSDNERQEEDVHLSEQAHK